MVASGAAALLTALLFVAVSIRIDVIAKSRELRNRAAQTLALFVNVLFIAILLSILDQSVPILGVELVVLALLTGGGLLILDRRARGRARLHPLPLPARWRRYWTPSRPTPPRRACS